MSHAPQLEILDLRHFSANSLRPVLEAESRVWSERLAWDYRASADLLLQYLDARVLPGFVAVEAGRVLGYAFCVYEERKAVIGDVFALSDSQSGHTQTEIETLLLHHITELLKNSPSVDRIESQLLLHAHNLHAALFQQAGFAVFRRLFMDRNLRTLPAADIPARDQLLATQALTLRPWHEADFHPAGSLIANAYEGHLDSTINDQYRSVPGSLRFLHNIIRFPGCGVFDPAASWVLAHRATGTLAAVILCSRVRSDVQHVTQICVAARARGFGLGTLLLDVASHALATRSFSSLSLTVTADNTQAVRLYHKVGFTVQHSFDAMVWGQTQSAASLLSTRATDPNSSETRPKRPLVARTRALA